MVIGRLVLVAAAIVLLMASGSCAQEKGDSGDVLVFSNPPESQRFKGHYAATRAVEEVMDFDHYLLGYGTDNPYLYIEYRNTSERTIKIEIGIIWYIARDLIVDQTPQHDIRPPVLPGQGEILVYTPRAGPPSKLADYYVEVHSLWDEQLPHISLGQSVGPMECTPVTGQEELTIAWGKNVSPEFKAKVMKISNRLEVDVNYLMAAMAFETAGTFDPSVTNPISGAIGLIQFLPSAVQNLETTTDELRNMSALEQLDYVERYFLPYQGRLTTLEDVYMAILWPKAISQAYEYTLFATPTIEYYQNRGLDLDEDGQVTKAEAAKRVRESLAEGLMSHNRG